MNPFTKLFFPLLFKGMWSTCLWRLAAQPIIWMGMGGAHGGRWPAYSWVLHHWPPEPPHGMSGCASAWNSPDFRTSRWPGGRDSFCDRRWLCLLSAADEWRCGLQRDIKLQSTWHRCAWDHACGVIGTNCCSRNRAVWPTGQHASRGASFERRWRSCWAICQGTEQHGDSAQTFVSGTRGQALLGATSCVHGSLLRGWAVCTDGCRCYQTVKSHWRVGVSGGQDSGCWPKPQPQNPANLTLHTLLFSTYAISRLSLLTSLTSPNGLNQVCSIKETWKTCSVVGPPGDN